MKRIPFFTIHRGIDANGIYYIPELVYGQIIETFDGYKYGLYFNKGSRRWYGIDLLTGLMLYDDRKNEVVQQKVLNNIERIKSVFHFGEDHNLKNILPYYIKMHDMICAEVRKLTDDQMPLRLRSYILTQGFRN